MFVKSDTIARDIGMTAFGNVVTPVRAAILIAAFIGLMITVWPLGLTSDYLNHLARNHIEAQVWFDSALSQYYAVSFEVIPDLAMDMVIPWLAHLTGIYSAGAMMMWVAFVSPPLVGLLIAKTVHGRVTWFALAGFLVTFNENMQWGFVNFVASTGLALLGFALWMRTEQTWRRAMLFSLFGAFLALAHALGFLLFGYLVLLWELACFVKSQRGSGLDFLRKLATKDVLAMAPGLVLIALATGGANELTHLGVLDFSLMPKLQALWSGAAFFNPVLARVVTVAIVVSLFLGLKRGVLQMDSRMVWVCTGMLVLVIVMPTSILGIWGLHYRYPAVLIILALSAITFSSGAGERMAKPVAFVTAMLLVAVFANGALKMSRIDSQARALREVLAELPIGARLLPARHDQADVPFSFHSAGMAVIERSAYVPNLFTNTSPVDVRKEMRAFHMPQARPLLAQELADSIQLDHPDTENGHWSPRYFFGWPEHWDYILYFRAEPNQSLDLAPLCLVAEKPQIALYRVSRNGCDTAS